MQFTDYWQRFEHTGRVEDYLNYLRNAGKEEALPAEFTGCSVDGRAQGSTDLTAGEDRSCRNPCM